MPELQFERTVSHSADKMLALVADVASYPSFVPNCVGMEVSHKGGEGSETVLHARMTAQLGPMSQSYTSEVVVDHDKHTVAARALDGPFSHLDSCWSFVPDGSSGCTVRFDINFAFSNRLIAAVAEPAFSAKQDEIMDAFVAEASRRFS